MEAKKTVPISETLHAKLQAVAEKERRTLRTVAEEILHEGLAKRMASGHA